MGINKKSRGFTLLETIIVVFLFTVISLALFGLFNRHNLIYNFEQASIKASSSSRTSLNEITTYALQAHQVLASKVINGVSYSSSSTGVVFEVPSIDSSGTTITGVYDYVAFSLSGKDLKEDIQANNQSSRHSLTRVVNSSIYSLAFTYDNNDFAQVKKVSVDIVAQEKNKTQKLTSHLEQTIRLRNY